MYKKHKDSSFISNNTLMECVHRMQFKAIYSQLTSEGCRVTAKDS